MYVYLSFLLRKRGINLRQLVPCCLTNLDENINIDIRAITMIILSPDNGSHGRRRHYRGGLQHLLPDAGGPAVRGHVPVARQPSALTLRLPAVCRR